MGKKKKKYNRDCQYPFEDYQLPPCAKFLGSNNPFVKDGKVVYKNINRLYFFITLNRNINAGKEYKPCDPLTYSASSNINLQIEPYYFFVSLFINKIQKGEIKNYNDMNITDDENLDDFIKTILNNDYTFNNELIPSISYSLSNSNSILPCLYGNIIISPINFYIIYMISRLYEDTGLLFGDNSYVTNDYINNKLANIYLEFL